MLDKKFLIIKGSDGLNLIFKFLEENNINSDEISVYERVKLDNYSNLKEDFEGADAIIFPSVYAADIFFEKIYTKNINAKLFCISNRILDQLNKRGYKAKILENYFSKSDLIQEIKKSI
jgi:uroporphyrinogen-III synthase